MSKSNPDKKKQLYTRVALAYASEYSRGQEQTRILFAIHDREWIAWYRLFEMSPQVNAAFDHDVMQGKDDPNRFSVFGRRMVDVPFQPRKPRRADEFCATRAQMANHRPGHAWKGGTARGILRREQLTRQLFRLNMVMLLDDFETIPLELEIRPRSYHPAVRETVIVDMFQMEVFTPGNLTNTARFRKHALWTNQSKMPA